MNVSTTPLHDAGWPPEMMNVLHGGMPQQPQYHYKPLPPAIMVPSAAPPPSALSRTEIGLIVVNVAFFILVLVLLGIVTTQHHTIMLLLQKTMVR